MKDYFIRLGLLLLAAIGMEMFSVSRAQDVPGAIKYQAVLRDVNGKPLSQFDNVNIRVSLRMDDPQSGQVAYSEEHLDIQTNAYGVIHLEIGRGHLLSGTALNDLDWGGHSYYVQIEVEFDGTGYTNMGTAELLTVPYAFMAGNVKTSALYENLSDGFLPRYNEASGSLLNSGISQTARAITVDASSVKFVNSAGTESGYTFPTTAGRKNQTLILTDNEGTLEWGTVSGGGGTVTDPFANLSEDGHLVYWNDPAGELETAPFVYDYLGGKNFSLAGALEISDTLTVRERTVLEGTVAMDGEVSSSGITRMEGKINADGIVSIEGTEFSLDMPAGTITINGEVGGTNNLMTDALSDASIWIGDNAGKAQEHPLSGHVLMDNAGRTSLNLYLKGGIALLPGQPGQLDTLAVQEVSSGGKSAGDSIWLMNATQHIYAYNKGLGMGDVRVGIGTDAPKERLHVRAGNILFDSTIGSYTSRFLWNSGKSALRAGGFDLGSDVWNESNIGNFSIALGWNGIASGDHSFAIGKDATVTIDNGFAIGEEASVSSQNAETNSFAIGNSAKVQDGSGSLAVGASASANGNNIVSIGKQTNGKGDNTIVIGQQINAEGGAIAIGSAPSLIESGAIMLGRGNSAAASSIVIGSNNTGSSGSIQIGSSIASAPKNSITIGNRNSTLPSDYYMGGIVIGHGMTSAGISIGSMNYDNSDGAVILGTSISVNEDHANVVAVGDSYDTETDGMSGLDPVFMVGSSKISEWISKPVAFEIVENGDAYYRGDVYVWGTLVSASDYRLKTDIKSLSCKLSILDSLSPVSFVYKTDNKNHRHFGFIAQNVRKYFPDLVREDAKGFLSLSYVEFVPVLWEINRELRTEVNDLRSEVARYKQKTAEQERRILELEKKLDTELEAIKEKIGL